MVAQGLRTRITGKDRTFGDDLKGMGRRMGGTYFGTQEDSPRDSGPSSVSVSICEICGYSDSHFAGRIWRDILSNPRGQPRTARD